MDYKREKRQMKDTSKIPKIIHYCWFGHNPLPPIAIKCIDSWKNTLPEYEIKEWNESNFDLESNTYIKQAYDCKKWAFVTDYIRLKVLYEYGGIYMDTDVEVLKPLDSFLKLPAFSGFESIDKIETGIIGAVKENKWVKELLEDYDYRTFLKLDGSYDLTPNVDIITNITKMRYSIKLDNSLQHLDDVSFYPYDWFCAKNFETGKITKTENTYTIHHFSGSWISVSQRFKHGLTSLIGINWMKRYSRIKQFISG